MKPLSPGESECRVRILLDQAEIATSSITIFVPRKPSQSISRKLCSAD